MSQPEPVAPPWPRPLLAEDVQLRVSGPASGTIAGNGDDRTTAGLHVLDGKAP